MTVEPRILQVMDLRAESRAKESSLEGRVRELERTVEEARGEAERARGESRAHEEVTYQTLSPRP